VAKSWSAAIDSGADMRTLDDEMPTIEREFSFLFTKWGYKIARKDEYRADHYAIWLESPLVGAKIWLSLERASVWGVLFGGKTAPLKEDLRYWKPIQKIFALLGRKVDFSPVRALHLRDQPRASLVVLARAIESVFDQIVELMDRDEHPQASP